MSDVIKKMSLKGVTSGEWSLRYGLEKKEDVIDRVSVNVYSGDKLVAIVYGDELKECIDNAKLIVAMKYEFDSNDIEIY